MAFHIKAAYPEPSMVFVGPGDPRPDNRIKFPAVFPLDGKEFTLTELYNYVGEPIDISRLPDGRFMVFNDEGKLNQLPVNVEATIIYRAAWAGHSDWAANDTIVGDVLLCEAGEVS